MDEFSMTPWRLHEISRLVKDFRKDAGDGKTPMERARECMSEMFWDTDAGHIVEAMLKMEPNQVEQGLSEFAEAQRSGIWNGEVLPPEKRPGIQTCYWYNEGNSSAPGPAVEASVISSPGTIAEVKAAAAKILEEVGSRGAEAVALARKRYHPDLFYTTEGIMLLMMLDSEGMPNISSSSSGEPPMMVLPPPPWSTKQHIPWTPKHRLFEDKFYDSEAGQLLLNWISGIRAPGCELLDTELTHTEQDKILPKERNVNTMGDCCGPDVHDKVNVKFIADMMPKGYSDPKNWPIRGHAPQFPGDGDEAMEKRHRDWINTDPEMGDTAAKYTAQVKHEVALMGFSHTIGKVDCYEGSKMEEPNEFWVQPLCAVNNTPLGCVVGSAYWRKGHLKDVFEKGQNYYVHTQYEPIKDEKRVAAIEIFLTSMETTKTTLHLHGKTSSAPMTLNGFNELFGTNIVEQVDERKFHHCDPGLNLHAITDPSGFIVSLVVVAPRAEYHWSDPSMTG